MIERTVDARLDCRRRAAPASPSVGSAMTRRTAWPMSLRTAGESGGQRSEQVDHSREGSCLFRVVQNRCKRAVEVQAHRHNVRLLHQSGGVPAEGRARVGLLVHRWRSSEKVCPVPGCRSTA
jgi:hypothetical protein